MHITAICPTYRKATPLATSLACWLLQDYPPANRQLVILDDGDVFSTQHGDTWQLYSSPRRFPSITSKYNTLLDLMGKTDAVLVWEDDDTYLPDYVSKHAVAFKRSLFNKPSRVLSDYPGKIVEERSDGRFHSSIGFRTELLPIVKGWPNTKRADFDQQFIANLTKAALEHDPVNGIGDPWPTGPIPFVYRWHTGHAHAQSTMDKGPADETWYDRSEQAYARVNHVGKLVPCLDAATKSIFQQLGYSHESVVSMSHVS